ncbi:hypothetical protein Dimus_038644 [Dionaea muscipula]
MKDELSHCLHGIRARGIHKTLHPTVCHRSPPPATSDDLPRPPATTTRPGQPLPVASSLLNELIYLSPATTLTFSQIYSKPLNFSPNHPHRTTEEAESPDPLLPFRRTTPHVPPCAANARCTWAHTPPPRTTSGDSSGQNFLLVLLVLYLNARPLILSP